MIPYVGCAEAFLKNLLKFLSHVGFVCGLAACAPIEKTPEQVFNSEIPQTVLIPNSVFYMGSTEPERETAYRLDEEAYRSPITREQFWYEYEQPSHQRRLRSFQMTLTPVTNLQYAQFVKATGHRVPHVTQTEWSAYGVNQPLSVTRKFTWEDGTFPVGRAAHPVVLVSYKDATAYAQWLSEATGQVWRLPDEDEWELAARGLDGRAYPWGNNFNPAWTNSADLGPHDTMAVGSFPKGASPFGLLDMAGQVYEWTRTPGEKNRMTVKGGAWDDRGCGVCRAAARHHRHRDMKHILIGFRLVLENAPN